MSQRYHRGYRYGTTNPKAVHNPLRSVPTVRPAAAVFGIAWFDGTQNKPKAAPVAEPVAASTLVPVDPSRELLNAEAGLHDAQRVHDAARRVIGDANRTHTEAVIVNGAVIMPATPFSKERIRERKSAAFGLFNKRRSQLATARRRVEAARAVLDLPSLAVVEERQAITAAVRASKQRPQMSSLAIAAVV